MASGSGAGHSATSQLWFRVSRQIFQRVFESVLNRGEFRSHLSRNAAGKFGIHPIV